MTADVPVIELVGLEKSFWDARVLQGLDLRVGPGELVGLIGPNGAGKSTALRILTGQLLPDAGTARIGGHDVQTAPLEARRALGYVPQEGGLEPFLTGEEVLRFVAEIRGVDPAPDPASVLREFGLSSAAHRLTREYSEGMARRLALAAALMCEPPALVLDESLNGLDPRGARFVREQLEIHRARGAGILLTGHVLWTLQRLCTRVALLHGGRIVLDLDADAIAAHEAEGRSLEDVFLDATA